MPSPHFPGETLDYIIDLLHDEPETLKECCLVAKSWVPRTRKHLFADIRFRSATDLKSWKKTFPDPSNSPAYHTHILTVDCIQVVTTADAEPGGWIPTFSRVVRLGLNDPTTLGYLKTTLDLFHKVLPTLKSLRIGFVFLPCPHIFDLVHYSPLLEDLAVSGYGPSFGNNGVPDETPTVGPPTSPAFTGSLDLNIFGGVGAVYAARRLLALPNGLHFRKFAFSWSSKEDLEWMLELVARCSNTLECLDVRRSPPCEFVLVLCWSSDLPSPAVHYSPTSIDLSKATILGEVVFRPGSPSVTWVLAALRAIITEHRDVQQISVHIPFDVALVDVNIALGQTVREAIYREWLDLDCLLVQFWESHSVRPKVIPDMTMWRGEQDVKHCVGRLLPEVTKRGVIDLIKLDVAQ